MHTYEIEKSLLTPSFYEGKNSRETFATKLDHIKQLISDRSHLSRDNVDSTNINCKADMESFVDALYFEGIVDLSEYTHHLTDKVLVWKMLVDALGKEIALKYHPQTIGLKEFLEKYNLVDENFQIIAKDKVEAALELEFPKGFIVKPNLSYNTLGKAKGFYYQKNDFLNDLLSTNELYQPNNWFKQYKFTEGAYSIYSPEMFLIQERLSGASKTENVKKAQEFAEIRVHSYQDKIIEGATSSRWDTLFSFKSTQVKEVNQFISEFLKILPKQITARQAWSFDISYIEGQPLRIIEINSNRGSHSDHWSGFLRRPLELTSYVRHFEKYYNYHFTGFDGFLLRNYLANYTQWRRRTIKRKKTKMQKIITTIIPLWPFPRMFK